MKDYEVIREGNKVSIIKCGVIIYKEINGRVCRSLSTNEIIREDSNNSITLKDLKGNILYKKVCSKYILRDILGFEPSENAETQAQLELEESGPIGPIQKIKVTTPLIKESISLLDQVQTKENKDFLNKIKNLLLNKKTMAFATRLVVFIVASALMGAALPTIPAISYCGCSMITPAASTDLQAIKIFIKIVINSIRVAVVSITALHAAKTGLAIATDEDANVKNLIKNCCQKVGWALFLVFVGTTVAEFFANSVCNAFADTAITAGMAGVNKVVTGILKI